MTAAFETICLRKILLPYRLATGYVRHRRDLPKTVPLVFDPEVQGPKFVKFVGVEDHPRSLVVPSALDRAGILTGKPPGPLPRVSYQIFAHDEIKADVKRKLEIRRQAGIMFDLPSYVRMLAKIADG